MELWEGGADEWWLEGMCVNSDLASCSAPPFWGAGSAFGASQSSTTHLHRIIMSDTSVRDNMAGKFLRRDAIVDTIKSDERMNAQQKRTGQMRYHVDVIACGCPDESCGAFHVLRKERPLPTITEAEATLRTHRRNPKDRHK